MTKQTVARHWRRAVRGTAIGALTTGVLVGAGVPVAVAEPTTTAPATPSPTAPATPAADGQSGTPQFANADQLLAFIDAEYDMGAGGGQLSKLIKSVMKLRAQGFRPSKANVAAITQALDYRPNQKPLIEALTDTLAYQQKIKAQAELLQQAQAAQNAQNSAVMGAGQMPSDGNPGQGGFSVGGGQTINAPIVP